MLKCPFTILQSPLPESLPEEHLEVVLKLIAVVEMLQSPLLLQFVLITIPKVELNVIYEFVHIRQRQDLLKTHLDGNRQKAVSPPEAGPDFTSFFYTQR